MALTATHAARLAGEERVLAFLRTLAPTDPVSVRLTTSARRGLRPAAELLRAQSAVHRCHVALAVTGHVAAHWIDAIVWGTAGDVEAFVIAVSPVLVRTAGRRARHEVGAIVAA
ncbi:MAG: hypothetical protein QOI54_3455 [Actinomycetota bacterium]|jgi:hypothetical protein|nr:hypothetical protein [Actinomycetota bacterium]